MTIEELKQHCKKQVKMCEEWAKGNGREPSGKTYEEHKLILDLIQALEQQPTIAQERFEDLEEYFGGSKSILEDRKEFKKWLERGKQNAKKVDELESKLEQQSDNCVSRAEILEEMAEREKNGDRITLGYIKNMPPVTPTHGTCKDCKHNDSKNNNMCRMGHRFALRESEYFYCADFKK